MRNPGHLISHQSFLWQELLRWLQPSMAHAHQEKGFRPGKMDRLRAWLLSATPSLSLLLLTKGTPLGSVESHLTVSNPKINLFGMVLTSFPPKLGLVIIDQFSSKDFDQMPPKHSSGIWDTAARDWF